jgi:hypothetical protein
MRLSIASTTGQEDAMNDMLMLFQSGAAVSAVITGAMFFILACGLAVLLITPSAAEDDDRRVRIGAAIGAALVTAAVVLANIPTTAAPAQQAAGPAKVEAKLLRPMARDGLAHSPGTMQLR